MVIQVVGKGVALEVLFDQVLAGQGLLSVRCCKSNKDPQGTTSHHVSMRELHLTRSFFLNMAKKRNKNILPQKMVI